jgi:hypothetical protein
VLETRNNQTHKLPPIIPHTPHRFLPSGFFYRIAVPQLSFRQSLCKYFISTMCETSAKAFHNFKLKILSVNRSETLKISLLQNNSKKSLKRTFSAFPTCYSPQGLYQHIALETSLNF